MACLFFLLAGCASPVRQAGAPTPQWTGRLALRVPDQPAQSISTGFELSGSAQAGQLRLLSPIGSTLALLTWSAAGASVQSPGRDENYSSLQALLAQASGADLPIATLFDWLAGKETAQDGWTVDQQQFQEGRITARRLQPAADIRIVLDP